MDIGRKLLSDLSNNFDDIKLYNTKPFYGIIIKPGEIPKLDWNHPDYVNALVSLPNVQVIKFNPEHFFKELYSHLELEKSNLKHLNTVLIGEENKYNYEMIYIDTHFKQTELEINHMATMLNLTDEVIKGSAIIIKNYIGTLDNEMYMVDMTTSELNYMIRRRGYNQICIYEDDIWREDEIFGETEDFAKQFFEGEKFYKIEIAFLKHNINIWYDKSPFGSKTVCGKLLKDPIEKCFIFTMTTDNIRGSISLDEIKKIIKLSTVLTTHKENIYKADDKWDEDEKDNYGRLIINNKYRILEHEFKKYFNLE